MAILNRPMFRSLMVFPGAILAFSATALVAPLCLAGEAPALQRSQANSPVDQLISWLLNEHRPMLGIPFAEVIFDTTGKRVLSVNPKDEIDQRVIKQIAAACDETIKQFNAPDSAIQSFMSLEAVTVVSALSISSQKWRPIRYATTPCTWSLDSNISRARKAAFGNSRAGTWSISRSSR